MKKLPTKGDIKEIIEMSLRPTWRIGIVYSSFYKEEIDQMVAGALKTCDAVGLPRENVSLYPVPGSFEIPLIGSRLAKLKAVDALIGLGIVVQGETHHARLIAESTAKGIMDVQLQYGIPFANEVLYVNTIDIARQRLHKGEEAALSVMHSLAKLVELQS